MAFHTSIESMLKESLREKIEVAEYCVNYRKDASWGMEQTGGCLGYIAAEMLFSIADSIGGFFRGNNEYKFNVDDKEKTIKGPDYTNLYILNSEYYDYQDLPDKFIKELYNSFRSPLIHNTLLVPERFLVIGENESYCFKIVQGKPFVFLVPFLKISREAYNKFIKNVDSIVPGSLQEKNFKLKELH